MTDITININAPPAPPRAPVPLTYAIEEQINVRARAVKVDGDVFVSVRDVARGLEDEASRIKRKHGYDAKIDTDMPKLIRNMADLLRGFKDAGPIPVARVDREPRRRWFR